MKDRVRLLWVRLQYLDGFCRRQHDQLNPAVLRLTLHVVHDGETAIRSGADDQARALPRNVFFRGKRGVAKRLTDGGNAPMQWVSVADLAEACIRAIEVPEAAGEAFNLAHPEPLTQHSFVEALARVAGVAPTFAPIPRGTIQAAGGNPFAGNLYFGEYLDIPPHTSMVEKAPRVLGVTPTSLEAALGPSYAWYRAQPRRQVDYAFENRVLAARA